MVKIVLEDKGQDLLWLKVNEGGLVEEAGPFQNEIWKDAYVPYLGALRRAILPDTPSSAYHQRVSEI